MVSNLGRRKARPGAKQALGREYLRARRLVPFFITAAFFWEESSQHQGRGVSMKVLVCYHVPSKS